MNLTVRYDAYPSRFLCNVNVIEAEVQYRPDNEWELSRLKFLKQLLSAVTTNVTLFHILF